MIAIQMRRIPKIIEFLNTGDPLPDTKFHIDWMSPSELTRVGLVFGYDRTPAAPVITTEHRTRGDRSLYSLPVPDNESE